MLTPKTIIHSDGNWFGDGSDGHIRITSAGAEQSQDGVVWSSLPGWQSSSSTVMAPSIEDGDMVIINAISLTIDAGMVLTTQYRCRGLLLYVQQTATINGTISMTARGPRCNPADAVVTADTPVAPTDGVAVLDGGLEFGWFAAGHSELFAPAVAGCGVAAVEALANQPSGVGVRIVIPRVGGMGGGRTTAAQGANAVGASGQSAPNAPGGGGGGGTYNHYIGSYSYGAAGAVATCFAGGGGGGGNHIWPASETYAATDAEPYGGKGGRGDDSYRDTYYGGDGPGNPSGGGPASAGDTGLSGLAGLLVMAIGGGVLGSGVICSDGSPGWPGYTNTAGGGGGGGGMVVVAHAGANQFTGIVRAAGGPGGADGSTSAGGPGGAGSTIGPIKIDPRR